MPSARANRARLRSVAFGEPSPTYPYRIFLYKISFIELFYWVMFLVFFRIILFRAMPSARATPGSLRSVAFGELNPTYPYRGNN